MTILITGAGPNSFLGKHILNEVKRLNLEPFDDYIAPSSKNLNLLSLESTLNFFKEYKIDKIIHLAANCGGILKNKNHPFDMIFDNTRMSINIFEAIKYFDIKYLYATASTCCYPRDVKTPTKEEYMWDGRSEPTNFYYAESKKLLISLFEAYKKQHGLHGAMFVPTNLFGPFDHFDLEDSHVIPALIRKFYEAALNNDNEVKCWGSGKVTRSFLYAKDCAEIILKAAMENFSYADPINLGMSHDISIKDLATVVAEIIDFKGKIVFDHHNPDGQPKRLLDVSRAKGLLDWEAKTPLWDGLLETIEYYKRNRDDILKV